MIWRQLHLAADASLCKHFTLPHRQQQSYKCSHASAQKLELQQSIQNCIACQGLEVVGLLIWPTAGEVVHPWSYHPLAQWDTQQQSMLTFLP